MRLDSKVLGLPASILLLVAAYSEVACADDSEKAAVRWPLNLVSNLRSWSGGSANRDVQTINEDTSNHRLPVGVMKMSNDEGEKFYMEYWQFEGNTQQQSPMLSMGSGESFGRRDEEDEALLWANTLSPENYRPAYNLHTEHDSNWQDLRARGQEAAAALAMLAKRQWSCPTGTSSCSDIGYPNSCCSTDETCFKITDTGLGPVGCCPNGSSCAGDITKCDYPNSACPDTLGGGCCIPNYVCAGVGCVLNTTSVAPVVVISTSVSQASTSVVVITIVTPVTATTTVTTSVVESSSSTSSSTSTATGGVAVRPTSSTSSTSDLATTCPTGFYACEAYYQGGCCRTGRNCDTTSCPATSSTTIISSGVTIVVPIGAAATTAEPTGHCASGWFSCAASVAGNCCPSGYECGTASCSTVEATATVLSPKEASSGGKVVQVEGNVFSIVGLVIGMLVIWHVR